MSLKNRVILIVTMIISIISISLTYIATSEQKKIISDLINTEFEGVDYQYSRVLDSFDKELTYRLDLITSNQKILEAFNTKNKETLIHSLNQIAHKDSKIKITHFIDNNNYSFLRLHNLDKFGDDLTQFRFNIVEANRQNSDIKGFESGISGTYYRVIRPIIYKDEKIGLVEVGVSIEDILKDVIYSKSIFGALYLHSEKEQNRLLYATNELFYYLKKGETISKSKATIKDGEYIFHKIDILNFKNENIGYLLFAKDITEHSKKLKGFLIYTMIAMFILIILAIFVIKYSFGYTLNKIEILNRELRSNFDKENRENIQNRTLLNEYKMAVDSSNIISKTDIKGIITYVNDEFCKISGYKRDELIGKAHNIIRHPNNPKSIFADLWKTIKDKKIWKGTIQNIAKDGKVYWVDSTIVPILDIDGNIIEFLGIRHDVTEFVNNKKMLYVDNLTGIPNRNRLKNDITSNSKIALLDIDSFNEINDFYGSSAGDFLLIEVSKFLSESLKNSKYILYRVFGDVYAILSSEDDSFDNFVTDVIEISKWLNNHKFIYEDSEINISVTIGFANESLELMENANIALKFAKSNKKHYEIYNNELNLHQQYENNILWTKRLKKALEENSVVPFFQPIINNQTALVDKYECLIRIKENNKAISPFFFLEISKKAKLYTHLTKIMVEKSFKKFENENYEFSINLSYRDIVEKEIKDYILHSLTSFKNPDRVVFELLESEGMDSYDEVYAFILEVKKFKCKIAIDDFGSGYSNFEHLLKLSVDYIKIDASLIKNIDSDKNSQIIVSTIVAFAQKMGIKTIAEFVSSQEIYHIVKELGIDYSQGFYFGAPNESLL